MSSARATPAQCMRTKESQGFCSRSPGTSGYTAWGRWLSLDFLSPENRATNTHFTEPRKTREVARTHARRLKILCSFRLCSSQVGRERFCHVEPREGAGVMQVCTRPRGPRVIQDAGTPPVRRTRVQRNRISPPAPPAALQPGWLC